MRIDPVVAREIFLAALEQPAGDRDSYVAQACGNDAELRARITALLRAHDAQGGLTLDSPAGNAIDDGGGKAGEKIGPYKLLQRLGEGGMGVVWMAEQAEPVRRKVALKVIKAGMDSSLVIARFEAERQALALMDHPHIARILDASTTATGQPYFVMELVKGIPITKYCDQEHLSPAERLQLFVPICQAVQHAHQKGIIHRDLKPSNIIVGLYDGLPVAKVIDFGVAKATSQRLTERTMFTEVGSIVGTIEYMAPEQAELNNLDIDTRADIYSLGVILYELLAGSPPFSSKQLRSAAFTEMLRVIREVEPPKPSTKLSSSDELPSIAANRHFEPRRLTRFVHGDLDWIVMKCLEKERSRRYETANGLAMDLQRFMNNEPVVAGPPARLYRLKKLVRRNRGTFIAASLVALALIAGICGTTWGLLQAQKSAEQERLAKVMAEKRRDQVVKANEVIGSIFQDLDPHAEERDGTPLRVQLRQRLDQAAQQITEESIGDRLTVAGLQDLLGWSQRGLGDSDQAALLLEKALRTRENALGTDHPLTLTSTDRLAGALHDKGENKKAIALFEKALTKRMAILGPNHRDTVESMNNLGLACQDDGQVDRAVELHQQAADLGRQHFKDDRELVCICMNNLAMAQHHRGRVDLAIGLYEEILADRNVRLGPDHTQTIGTVNNLALAYMEAKGLDKAKTLLEKLVSTLKEKVGADHPLTMTASNNLALAHHESGRVDLAIPIYQKTLEQRRIRLGPDHQHTLGTMNNLAFAYRDVGQMDRAVALYETAFEKTRSILGPDNPDAMTCGNNLALAYQSIGQNERARSLFEDTFERRKKILGPDHLHTLITMHNVGGIWLATDRKEEAVELLQDAANRAEKNLGPDHAATLTILNTLGDACLKTKQFERGEQILRTSLKRRDKAAVAPWTTEYTRAMLGASLLGQNKYAEAEPLLVAGYQGLQRTVTGIPVPVRERRLSEALNNLVRLYEDWQKPDEAAKWKQELEHQKSRAMPPKP